MKQLHYLQLQILTKLLFSSGLSYTEAKPTKSLENNQYDFHLKTLIRRKLVRKTGDKYYLTTEGKTYAGRIDTDEKRVNLQAKISLLMWGIRKRAKIWEYLVYTRKKHPFYGCQGGCSGKLAYGESVLSGARREFKEETNLEGSPELVLIRHFLVLDKITEKLVEDKFMFMCRFVNPTGTLQSGPEGEFEWVAEKDVKKKIVKPFDRYVLERDIERVRKFKGSVAFEELEEYTDKF